MARIKMSHAFPGSEVCVVYTQARLQAPWRKSRQVFMPERSTNVHWKEKAFITLCHRVINS